MKKIAKLSRQNTSNYIHKLIANDDDCDRGGSELVFSSVICSVNEAFNLATSSSTWSESESELELESTLDSADFTELSYDICNNKKYVLHLHKFW